MPTFLHGKNSRILLANPTANTNYDISQFFNDVSVTRNIETPETTTFQGNGFKTYIPGLKAGAISLTGFYEGSASGLDAILTEALTNDADDGAIVFPDGGTAENSRCLMARGIEGKYDLKSPVSGVVGADTELAADGGVWNGRGIFKTISTSYNSTAYNYGSTTTRGGLVIMGCTALTGTSPTLTLTFQHSSDGSTWVNFSPSVSVSGVGTTVTVINSSIYAYTRISATVGGTSPSATIYFGFARY